MGSNHRAGHTPRSGDTHVIGKDGHVRNVDGPEPAPKRALRAADAPANKRGKPSSTPSDAPQAG